MKWLQVTELVGQKVKLIHTEPSHRASLVKAAADGELSKIWYTSVPDDGTIDAYLKHAWEEEESDRALIFTVIDAQSNRIVGSTRYCNATPEHRRVEIGYTWYAKSVQRTGVNTECKYLLLSHAFEQLNAIAVEFKTNWHNHPSRKAILRLGAKQDGILRNHRIGEDGILRDTVVFSITREEWPSVKKALSFMMQKYD